MEWIAHRGESIDAPENTLAAVNLAWRRGLRKVEIDIHLNADGDLIVCHDADTMRTTGVSRIIAHSTTAELRALDAGRWRGEQWAGERLPLIGEVLATIPADGCLLVEIKDDGDLNDAAVAALAKAIADSNVDIDRVQALSFNADAILAAKRAMPGLRTQFIFWIDNDSPGVFERWDRVIDAAHAAEADALAMGWPGLERAQGIERAKKAGLGAYVWTIDEEADAARAAALSPDGITSNRAGHMARLPQP